MRTANALPWVTWAALTGVGIGSSTEFDVARAAGLGPVCAGAVALAADVRTLGDLSARYGRQTALWGSTAVMATLGTVTLLSNDRSVPVLLSASAAVVTHILNKPTEEEE